MAKMFAPTEFLKDVRRYVIINSTDEWLDMRDQGTCWGLPPSGVVVQPTQFHPRAPVSHADPETGELIPGTLVVSDTFQPTPDGGNERMVDVETAIKTSLGYDPNVGEYTDPERLGVKGVSVVPFTADRDLIEAVREDGLERFRKWKIKESLDLVDAHDLRNEARRRVGMTPLPPSRDYVSASAAVDALRAEDVAKYREQFALRVEGQPDKEIQAPVGKEEVVQAIMGNAELVKMLATALKANEISETAGVSDKTASKLAQVEQEMKEIEQEKESRRKYKAG